MIIHKRIIRSNLMSELPIALKHMGTYKQFILCKLVKNKNKLGKTDKFPVDYRTMKVANAHSSDIWLDAQTAINIARLSGEEYRVGFVFTDNDPFFFVDIDNCLEPDGKTWSPVAIEIMEILRGAAVEISQSGKGLHIFAAYKGEMPVHSCKNIPLGLELYHKDRFVVLTGVMI